MSHTPTPWQFEELRGNDGLGYIRPVDADYKEISHHGDAGRSAEENRANARLIVRAVNAFEPMREALEHCEALVVGWACHHAMQGAQTEADYRKATSIEGWHPVHRKIYEDLKAALALADKEKP